MHIFHKADDDHKSRANSSDEKHGHQYMVKRFKKELHFKSVLRTKPFA